MGRVELPMWAVEVTEDEDHHLNIYIPPNDGTGLSETDCGIGCQAGDELHLRSTSEAIEDTYWREWYR